MPTLARQLDAFYAAFLDRAEPAIAELFERRQAALAQSGVIARARRSGETAPDFTLHDQSGQRVSLSGLLATGPVVLTFFRGGWCPFCTLTLRALAKIRTRLVSLGAELVAVSPEAPAQVSSTTACNGLAFPVLSDHDNVVARSYGLTWSLDLELQQLYTRLGHALPDMNGTQSWELPMPASYVIAPDGRIALSHVDPRVQSRIEPETALAKVRELLAEPTR